MSQIGSCRGQLQDDLAVLGEPLQKPFSLAQLQVLKLESRRYCAANQGKWCRAVKTSSKPTSSRHHDLQAMTATKVWTEKLFRELARGCDLHHNQRSTQVEVPEFVARESVQARDLTPA